MGTGWRRAFCTSIRRDPETTSASTSTTILEQQSPSSSRSFVKLGIGIFSGSGGGGSNPSSNQSTPRLRSTTSTPRCRLTTPPPPPQQQTLPESPRLQCKTTTALASDATSTSTTPKASSSSIIGNSKEISPRLFRSSSPRSPSRFALFKTALRLSRNRCGICGEGVRSSVGAVFTAECSHAFHFPCISSRVRAQGCLVCPVCSITWNDAPLLASSLQPPSPPAAPPPNAPVSARRHHSRHSTRPDGERASLAAAAAAAAGSGGGSINPKIYDDDESLQLSPTGRVADGLLQFNPIPEELEAEDGDKDDGDDDDGDVECQHKENFKQEGELQRADGIKAALSMVPDSLALVSTSRNHLTYVVSIKVKAPPLPPRPQSIAAAAAAAAPTLPVIIPQSLLDHPSCRAPIDLVTVLDVSGNMTATKLQMLKRAMRLVISSLGPGDRLSIVAFSVAAAKRLFPLRRMSRTGQRSARQIVDRLVICGTTQAQARAQVQGDCSSASCMGDALRKATKVLEDRRERNPIATIMLLSDVQRQGHDQQKQQNVYATTPRSNSGSYRRQNNQTSSATRFAHIEIPIHASASFQDLQKQKQQQQRKRANPPNSGMLPVTEEENAFANCMNGLVSMVLQDVRLQLTLPSASGVISSVYSYSYGGASECDGSIGQAFSHGEGGKSVSLGDLYVDEVRQLLVELKVPKAALLEGHAMSNISIMCSYRDLLTQDVIRKPFIMPVPMPLQSQGHNERQTDSQFPVLLRSFSSSSSTTTAQSNQDDQQQLRNLFVTTRAVAESRRLVELSDLDTAIHLLSSARSLLLQHLTTAVVSNTQKKLVLRLEAELQDLQRVQQEQHQQQRRWRRQQQPHSLSPSHRRWSEQALLGEARGGGGGGEPLTPTSAWRAAEQLAKVAITRKSLNRVSDLHGLENARF